MEHAGQLVVASDIRNTLFRRALNLLDEVHAGLEDFNSGGLLDDSPISGDVSGASSWNQPGSVHSGTLVLYRGGDPLERVLATFVQGRTSTARRAVGAVAQIYNEIDSILSSFERDFPPIPTGSDGKGLSQGVSFNVVTGQPSEEVLRMAAATTAAAARFRVRAAEAAKAALQVYDNAAKKAAAAAQATTQALEMQILAEQHSAAGNLPQALDSIRQANRLRDESAEAARLSRQFQKEYGRHRREAQEAHFQADAAMRHAYSLEQEALKSSSEAAGRQHEMWKDRYERLSRQVDELRAQAANHDAAADAAVARAEQAQHQADTEMTQGNYDLGNALMQEAVRSQEQAGYARAQAQAARDSLQRLMPDLQAARERMEEAECDVEDLVQRQARLQDATTKQRTDRLREEADEMAALCAAAEGAASMHEDLVHVYEQRLAQDRQQYAKLASEGRITEADALAVHITTWEELLNVARKNLHASRTEAKAMRKRLTELSKADVSKDPAAAIPEGAEDFRQLREAKDKESLAAQAVAILARGLASVSLQDATVEGAGPAGDKLLLQTEMHRQRIARLAEQMDNERQRLEAGQPLSTGEGQSTNAQGDALLDSMAVSHLVGTLETTRLLQLWKQRSEQAVASALEMRKTWSKLEQNAASKADEAVRLEEQAIALEQAGRTDEASSTMAQAEQLHRIAEQLRLEADKAKSALIARETAAGNAQAQSRSLVQGLYDVEYAAGRLQSELGRRGYNIGDPETPIASPDQSPAGKVNHPQQAGTRTEEFSPEHDEMATVMMASPSILSRKPSTAGGTTKLAFSIDTAGLQSYGGQYTAKRDGVLVAALSSTFASVANLRDQEASPRQLGHLASPPLELWSRGSSMLQALNASSYRDDNQTHHSHLARLVQELEAHAVVAVPHIPICRWEGHAGLVLALQTEENNEDAILATYNELMALREELGNGVSITQMQVQRDEQRKARWEEVVAALKPIADVLLVQVAERTQTRCTAVVVASNVTEDALALQANCQDALILNISSLRHALVYQRSAAESARLAQAEAVSTQHQLQDAEAVEAELLKQVRALQDQVMDLEPQGSTGQLLTTRFELQRLQNKQADAAARATQLSDAYTAAQQVVDEAHRKEVTAKASVQAVSRTVMTLADAAKEATVCLQHAIEGYHHAVLALALGAKADLARLGSGDAHDIQSSDVDADADVQTHIQQYADCVSQAQQSLEAARRLQQLADIGATPMLSPVTSRAATNTSVNAFPAAEHGVLGPMTFGSTQIAVTGAQPVLGQPKLLLTQSNARNAQPITIGNSNLLLKPLAGEKGSPAPSGLPLLRPLRERPEFLGSGNPLLRPSADEQLEALGGSNSLLRPSGLRNAIWPASSSLFSSSRRGVDVPGVEPEAPDTSDSAMQPGRKGDSTDSCGAVGGDSIFSVLPAHAGQPRVSLLGSAKTGACSVEAGSASALSAADSSLLGAIAGLKLQDFSLTLPAESRSLTRPTVDEQLGSLQALLSGKLPTASCNSGDVQDAGGSDNRASVAARTLTEQLRSASDRLGASLGTEKYFLNTEAAWRSSIDFSASNIGPSTKAPGITRLFQAARAAKCGESDGSHGKCLSPDSQMGADAGPRSISGLFGPERSPAANLSSSGAFEVRLGSAPPMASGTLLVQPGGQDLSEVGFGRGQDLGSTLGWQKLSSGHVGAVLGGVDRPLAYDVKAIEAELATLHAHHQQQRNGLTRKAMDGARLEQDPLVMRRMLEAELQEAEGQLRATQVQQTLPGDASPAELQASNDRVQYHEQRVAMLHQALEAFSGLSNDNESLARMRDEKYLADLEAQQCDENLALLSKAAEMCSKAVRELHFQALDASDQAMPKLRQDLADVQEVSADIGQRQRRAHLQAERLQEQRNQLMERLASQQAAVKLREDWMQQARKAAAAATDAMDWDRRLTAARTDLQKLEAPLQELRERADAAMDAAQKMGAAAAQHRKQGGDLARQAMQQREDARRFAAHAQYLDAEAAKAMTKSLQQQADGLIAQAALMEEDAHKLFSEANELGSAAECARNRITVQTQVVEQVSRAYQLSASALYWNSVAAVKLHDALQKQVAAAQQQLALEQVERDLFEMEGQKSDSSGGGGARPDELANHMIHIVRAKQEASRMRAALQTVQQQVEHDCDAASAAVRQAAQAEGERTRLEPKIQELELQARVSLHGNPHGYMQPSPDDVLPEGKRPRANDENTAGDAGDAVLHSTQTDRTINPGGGVRLPTRMDSQQQRSSSLGPHAGDGANPGPRVAVRIQAQREGEDTRASASADPQSSISAKVQLPALTRTIAVAQEAPQPQLRVGLPFTRTDKGKPDGDAPDTAASESRRNQLAKRTASLPTSAVKARCETGSPAVDSVTTPNKWGIAVGIVNAARDLAVSTPLPVRLAGGASQTQAPASAVSSPTGSVAGAAGARIDWSPRDPTSRRVTGQRGQHEDVRSERSYSHTSISAAAVPTGIRPNRSLQPIVQHDESGPAVGLQRIGTFRSPERNPDRHEELNAGTAGALLDRVANKSLKPLSHVKILNASGKPVAQPYQSRESTSSFESGTMGNSGSGSGARTGSTTSSHDDQSDSNPSALAGGLDEELQMEDDGSEPDTKMYRTIKQKATELEGQITQLRRQGDTARTAADILAHKQEQRRADMSAAVDTDETLQMALLEHGDAMIRMKEAESGLCHKQADFLEEEMAVCRDALQYAIVDWRYRREMKRLDERCTALTERAQNRAEKSQGFDAEAADANECIMLATSKAIRGGKTYTATLEQQQVARFIEQQQERLKVAGQRAAESRSEAAQIANIAKGGLARKLLVEKKTLCNKALYQSAVELADAYEHAARIVGKVQHVKMHGLKVMAEALAERVQQLEAEVAALQEQNAKSSAGPVPSKLRKSKSASARAGQQSEAVVGAIMSMSSEVEEAIQQCLQEITNEKSDVLSVHRRRMEHICALVRLYQTSYDCGDHQQDETAAVENDKPLAPSEVAKRAARITAMQDAVLDLDRACGIASQLRVLSLDAAEAHGALFDLRADPGVIRAQLLGHKPAAHDMDREELDARKQHLALLEIEIPLARDQLTAALQILDYRQAAAQLAEARKELLYAAAVAADAVTNLESTMAVRRENLAVMHRHTNSALHEAHIFTANGNILQAAVADEAAERFAKQCLVAETALATLVQECQLKREEQSLAGAAAEELQQVADGSLELVGLLLRIVNHQQEVRTISRRINEFADEQARHEKECESRKSMAKHASNQVEQLQHESLQCRTNLKFNAADAHLNESRQCRATAQEHSNAAEVANLAAASAARQHKCACLRRTQLLREVHLLHTAAGHLQGALSCMRDKHHLVRKLRDVEYQRRHGRQAMEPVRSSSPGPIPEKDVLQTQVDASNATVKHHLASKTSYVMAADNLHLAGTSLERQATCALQADVAMQDITKARVAVAMTSARCSLTLSVPLLTGGRSSETGAAGDVLAAHVLSAELALVQRSRLEETSLLILGDASSSTDSKSAALQLQQAELRYRCLRGSLTVLETIAAAAERASEARCRQVDLSDQAAVLVSDLAAKILEAEACANEAASLEAAVRINAALLDEDDEENVKVKLMLNALLQKAESYRNEALLLQGRIKELEEQERAAGAKASNMEDSLVRLQADHRHALDALELTERISQSREHEAAARLQMQTLSAEVAQLEREAKSMENKILQLRQQLTNASHTACSEDVANVMLVMQQIDNKLAVHRQLLQQRRLELESSRVECEHLSVDIAFMKQRTEYTLHASEIQEQVWQTATRVAELQSDLFSAQSSRKQCEGMLDELRQQYLQLGAPGGEDVPASEAEHSVSRVTVRQSQQMAATQAAITLAEQMLETHTQRVEVLQAAFAAWEAAKQRQEALLRHQEQLMQQDSWRATLEQHRAELRKAADGHVEKAKQLRANADKCSNGAALLLTADPDANDRSNESNPGAEVLSVFRAQAATIRAASEAAEQHARAEAEETLAARASTLAQCIDREIECFSAASDLVQPMYERLCLAATAAISVARLQLACVGICSDQGRELTTMHDALAALRGLAAKIQGLLEAAERHTLAGHNMEAAAARGQATAIQDALQQELSTVRLSKQRLTELTMKMEVAKQELHLADKRMAQVTRSAAATQSVTEYVHRACELRYECGERQFGTLQILHQAADAAERAEVARQELKASQEAAKQLTQAGKRDSATIVGQAVAVLKRSLMEAEAERRLSEAQVVQEANACGSEVAAAGLYMELAELTMKLLQHMDEMELHQEEHEQLQGSLEASRRSHEASNAMLVHRRAEMQTLTGQIETHKCESQLQRRMGNEAQAAVRQEAAAMLTSQLAEIAEEVMKLEKRCEGLEQKQTLLSSLYVKSESRMGLLSHMARLCSAAVGHLLDARDAHDNHSANVREGGVAAVELSKGEEMLSAAEARVQELRKSLEDLISRKRDGETGDAEDEGENFDKLQHNINLAQAELMLAHRRRAEAEQQVLASRARGAQAELAAQSSQLRITKARQRAEDAQQLVTNIRTLLSGSKALVINLEALQGVNGTSPDMLQALPTDGASRNGSSDLSHPHGILAAAQLHSVTLQALTEAASKFVQALDCAAAAEQRRSDALSSTQAAQAAREAAGRQQAAAEELRIVAEGISVLQHVQQLTRGRSSRGGDMVDGNGVDHNISLRTSSAGGQALPSLRASSVEQDAAVIAELELERLQHEAAYKEANAAQERKLAACFLQQQKLLRLASKSLLEMARFGVAAELNAGPNMTPDEASSLLAACKQLAEQHATTIMLGPAMDSCKHAEEYLVATLQCVQEAKNLRDKAIGDRIAALEDRREICMQESNPALRALVSGSRSPGQKSIGGSRVMSDSVMLPLSPAEDEEAKAAARLAEYNQLLADEEHMLVQVQELDKAATAFLEESNFKALAFTTRWTDAVRPGQATYCLPGTHMDADFGLDGPGTEIISKEASPPEVDSWSELCSQIVTDVPMSILPLTILKSSTDVQSHIGGAHATSGGPEGFVGELSLRLIAPVTGGEKGNGKARDTHALAQSIPGVHPQTDPIKEQLGRALVTKAHKGGPSSSDIDEELVAMAAATVARAKAAAAALAVKASSALNDRRLPGQYQPDAACATSQPVRNGPKDDACRRTEKASPPVVKAAHGTNLVKSAGGVHRYDVASSMSTALQRLTNISAELPASFLPHVGPQCTTSTESLTDSEATSPRLAKAHIALPQLPNVPLPDDICPATAAILQDLWSTAALHYQRTQHMHDCSLQQAERQWQRCQAQVQMLQTEELKARSGGRLSEVEVVAAGLARWQQRARHLDTAIRRHRHEFARHKALALRATIIVERLQLMAAACSSDTAATSTAQHDNTLHQLLPRLPNVMLAGCGVMQPLERLHAELVQQVAALHTTVAGLQQQSQRLFGKASRRSKKLKIRLGASENTAAHALALAKSQSAAEQSAALGERAVELAAHARTAQELAERLSGESANCLHILERLQHACDQELQAQQALVHAADLILCEAMQAVLRGERGPGLGLETITCAKPDVAGPALLAQLESQTGDFDSLLQARLLKGACLTAARMQAQRGEDLAQDAARAVQTTKEVLEMQMGPFARHMDDAAAAFATIASTRSAQCDVLKTQVDAAAACVARARSKLAAHQAARNTAAAEKYSRAAEGWAKQAEKLRKEVLVTSAAAEEIGSRGQALALLGSRLRPIQAALDRYLDQQLEAWAAAALARM